MNEWKKKKEIIYFHIPLQAITIQKNVRSWICRRQFRLKICKVITAQSAVRRFLARRELKLLKKEARSVQHHITLNKGLENKIIKLQQQIGELVSKKPFQW